MKTLIAALMLATVSVSTFAEQPVLKAVPNKDHYLYSNEYANKGLGDPEYGCILPWKYAGKIALGHGNSVRVEVGDITRFVDCKIVYPPKPIVVVAPAPVVVAPAPVASEPEPVVAPVAQPKHVRE
jgi:hypothetical protein